MKAHRIFFFLTLLLLPSQLGFHFWPETSLVLGRRVDYLSPTLYLTDLLILGTLATWVFEHRATMVKILPIGFKILMVLLFACINVSVSSNKFVTVYMWIKVLEFGLFVWYMMKTRPSFSSVVTVLSVGLFYSSGIAIVQFYLQHTIGGLVWWLGERTFSISTPGIARMNICGMTLSSCRLVLRAYGTFAHPNVLAGYLVALLPLLYTHYLLEQNKTQTSTRFFLGIVALGVIALLLSMSRSAIVVGSLVLIFIIMKRVMTELNKPQREEGIFTWLHGAVGIICIVIVVLGVINVRRLVADDESVVVRGQLNGAAIQIVRLSPLLGVGLGNFLVKLPGVLPSRTIYFLQPVHNIYLLLLAETGVIGLTFFLTAVAYTVCKHMHSIVTVSLLALLVLGLVDHYLFTLQQGQLLLATLIGLSFSDIHQSSS